MMHVLEDNWKTSYDLYLLFFFSFPYSQLLPTVAAGQKPWILEKCATGSTTVLPKCLNHRYLKNIDSLSFVVCPLLVPHLQRHFPFFAAAFNSTNKANKAGGTCY